MPVRSEASLLGLEPTVGAHATVFNRVADSVIQRSAIGAGLIAGHNSGYGKLDRSNLRETPLIEAGYPRTTNAGALGTLPTPVQELKVPSLETAQPTTHPLRPTSETLPGNRPYRAAQLRTRFKMVGLSNHDQCPAEIICRP